MLAKIKAAFEVFQKGKAVANPAAWKMGGVTANMIAALLVAIVGLAAAFGYDVRIDDAQIEAIAGAVIALFAVLNSFLHITTSTSVGITPKQGSVPAPEREADAEAVDAGADEEASTTDTAPISRAAIESSRRRDR